MRNSNELGGKAMMGTGEADGKIEQWLQLNLL